MYEGDIPTDAQELIDGADKAIVFGDGDLLISAVSIMDRERAPDHLVIQNLPRNDNPAGTYYGDADGDMHNLPIELLIRFKNKASVAAVIDQLEVIRDQFGKTLQEARDAYPEKIQGLAIPLDVEQNNNG